MIIATTVLKGHNTLVNFLNSPVPVSGAHMEFVATLKGALTAAEYGCFVVEVYGDTAGNDYRGCLVVIEPQKISVDLLRGVIFIDKDSNAVAYNYSVAVDGVFVTRAARLDKVNIGQACTLNDVQTDLNVGLVATEDYVLYGANVIRVKVQIGADVFYGTIVGAASEQSVVPAYQVMFPPYSTRVFYVRSAKPGVFKYSISIAPGVAITVVSTRSGQELAIPDTPVARQSVADWVRRGYLFNT